MTDIGKLASHKVRIICKANCKYSQNYDRICMADKILFVQTDPDTPKLVCTYYQAALIPNAEIAQNQINTEADIQSAVQSDVAKARQRNINKNLLK